MISKNTTIKALAVKDKMESEVVTFAYTVSEKLSTPQASIESGSVVAAGTVVPSPGTVERPFTIPQTEATRKKRITRRYSSVTASSSAAMPGM